MCNYFKNINEVYGIKKIIINSIIISFLVVFLDKINLFSTIIKEGYSSLIIILSIGIIISLISVKKGKLFLSKAINHIDICFISCQISLIIVLINLLVTQYVKYKFMTLIILLCLITILIIVRMILTNKKSNYKSNVYDLEYLCNHNVDISNDNIALLEEKEVSYDLLDRTNVINQLYNVIVKCNPSQTFTIGLQGAWGEGKTTIVNNVLELVKKNNLSDDYVIVKFDPWSYENEKAILKGLMDEILIKLNLNYRLENIDKLIEGIVEIVFYDSKVKPINIIKNTTKLIENKLKIENLINNYLKGYNKKMILIVDNMDRVDTDKVKFLLKSISTILKFERTIYVLLYDSKIIEKELHKLFGTSGNNYETKYMDKIVQLKIDVPKIDQNCMNSITEKLAQNIKYNNKCILNDIFNNEIEFANIRELKIFVNNILSSIDSSTKNLNIKDLVNLEFIKSKNINLFYDIWKNKDYYITDDRIYEPSIYTLDYSELNRKAKEHFDNLFADEKNQQYKNILESMFPNVDNYFKKYEIFNSNCRNTEQYNSGIIDNRIYNARYFQLYFTKNENDFIWINSKVSKTIDSINNRIKIFEQEFIETIEPMKYDELRVFMEVFELNVNNINHNKLLKVAKILYKNINKFYDRVIFFGLDSRKRNEIVISKMITMLNKEEFNEFLNYIKEDYKNINLNDEIIYWMENNNNKNASYINQLKEVNDGLCKNIIDKNIDIYSDKNYSNSNIWTLYRYDNDKTKEYISKNLNKNNIFRFLRDLITMSCGNKGYGYTIKNETISLLLPNKNIDDYVYIKNKKLTSDERFIIEIYEKSKNKKDPYEDTLHSDEYIDFKNI